MELNFNEIILKSKIERLSHQKRIIFILLCCERLYPNYVFFSKKELWGEPYILRYSIDLVWMILENEKLEEKDILLIKRLIKECEYLAPDTEDFNSIYVSPALDAVVSIILLLELLLKDSVKKVVEAATLARDTVDMYIQELESLDINDPELERKILTHTLMQEELKKQKEDIEYLIEVNLTKKTIIELKDNRYRKGKSNINL